MLATLRRVNDIIAEIDAVYHEAAAMLQLSDSALCVLYTICECGDGCALSLVYKRTGISRQTINSALRKLEQEDVLYLESAGGKAKRLRLTAAGRQLVQSRVLPLMEAENRVLQGWTPAEQAEYLRLAEKYAVELRQQLSHLKEEVCL